MNSIRLVLSAFALMLAAGCASPPPAPPAAPAYTGLSPAQKVPLRGLKFVESDNGWNLDLGARIAFNIDSWAINAEDGERLARVAKVLLDVGIDHMIVEGHSDRQGSDAYNMRLSEHRTNAVADALTAKGFTPGNVTRRSYGAMRPVAYNTTAAGRTQNRRAVLIVPSL